MEAKIKKPFKRSIREKIVTYFILLAISTIIIFEIYTMYTVRFYYYSSIEGIIENQARTAAEYYSTYLGDYSLEDVIIQDRSQFYRHLTDTQVQILNNNGLVMFDSIGSPDIGQELTSKDVEAAKKGEEGTDISTVAYLNHRALSVTKPLLSRGEQVGMIRLVTSLDDIDGLIQNRYLGFLSFGFVALLITGLISLIMARSIVRPIQDLTKVAEKLTNGQFKIKAVENDYDEIGQLGKTLNLMTKNIEEKEQLKNDFISSVSHELRTPLTSINGWAKTLEYDPEDTELVKEGLQIISSECNRLSALVEDLLDFSRFTSGRIQMEKKIIDMKGLVLEIVRQLTPRALSHQISLVANYEEQEELFVGDPHRIKQVLINLIDNAIKFTPADGTVLVNLFSDDRSISFEVIDTGVGIPAEEISHITEKFYKGNAKGAHTGLGLSISEEIVKLHQGTMIIKSKVGEGTTVTVSLPKGEINHDESEY